MKVYIFPRLFFEELKGSSIEEYIFDHFNIISINTPEYKLRNIEQEKPPFLEKYWNNKNVLILYFHDWTTQDNDLIQLISDQDIEQIVNFANKIDKTKDLIIHCTAGISRSGAIGSCLNKFFNEDSDDLTDYNNFINNHKHLRPNTLVFQKLYDKLEQIKNKRC